MAAAERMEWKAHEERLGDSGVAVSNVLALAVVAPERLDTLLFVHMKGHPRIDGRPILLGDRVSFALPVNWRNRDLALEELAGLAFEE